MRYLFDDYELDAERRELRHRTIPVAVEPQVFDLLVFLIRNRDHVVSRDDLFQSIWQGRIVSDSTLDTCISAARSAVGDSGDMQRLIKTFPRRGIRFVSAVREGTRASRPAGADAVAEPATRAFPLPDRPSIAVLPFTNMSGDPEQNYFADGMAEEIIMALSRCNWLFVIARNSSFMYRGQTVDIREVGRELGVRYVLEGSVRRGGVRLRITGQLIDAISGAHIWADRFDGEMSDVFDLQDRITENVVAAIEPKLQLAEIERLKRKPAESLDAYDLLLRAQALEYEFTQESLTAALHHLKDALALDPDYAAAMALAAYCHAERRVQGWMQDPAREVQEGLHLATRALELGGDDGNVLWMTAWAVRQLAMDGPRSRELASRSLLLNPNSAIAVAIAGWTEVAADNAPKGLELFRRAQRLSPRDPKGWFFAAGVAHGHYLEGNLEEAALWARKALVQKPQFAIAQRYLAASLAKLGQREQASQVMADILKNEPQLTLRLLRSRLMFLHESGWEKFSDGLRLAGLPE
jgi:TolB-like protein